MRNWFVAALTVLGVFAFASLAQAVEVTPGQGVSFSQIDFTFELAFVPDSAWGYVEVDIAQLSAQTGITNGYLNVRTDTGWVVDNLILIADIPIVGTYFDVGVPDGTDILLMSAHVEYTDVPLNEFPDGARSDFPVGADEFNAEGVDNIGVTADEIGAPPEPIDDSTPLVGNAKVLAKQPAEPNVEAADKQCFPMAVANSLDYLRQEFGYGVGKLHPHESTVGLNDVDRLKFIAGQLDKFSKRMAGETVSTKKMVDGKFEYLKSIGLENTLRMRFQQGNFSKKLQPNAADGTRLGKCYTAFGSRAVNDSNENGRIDATGRKLPKDSNIEFNWLVEQLKAGEDVEITFVWNTTTSGVANAKAHAVRLVLIGEKPGKGRPVPILGIVHDRSQAEDGGTVVDQVKISKNVENQQLFLHLGKDGGRIEFAFSESVPKPPDLSLLDSDGDLVSDDCDVCLLVSNPGQEDGDDDLVGDVCDNCPTVINDQADSDADGIGDACDNCPFIILADAGPDQVTPISGTPVLLDASGSLVDQCSTPPEFRWRIGAAILRDFTTDPTFVDAPSLATEYTVDVRCPSVPLCQSSDSVLVAPANELEVSGTPETLGSVTPLPGPSAGPPGRAALTTWTNPSVGGPFTTYVVSVNVNHNGQSLRTAPGANQSVQLRNSIACNLGVAAPTFGNQVALTDSTLSVAFGEVVGYLALAITNDGVIGTLGRGERGGNLGSISRGLVDPRVAPVQQMPCTP